MWFIKQVKYIFVEIYKLGGIDNDFIHNDLTEFHCMYTHKPPYYCIKVHAHDNQDTFD